MIVVPFKSRPTFSADNDLAKYPARPIIGQACRRCFSLFVQNNTASPNVSLLVNVLQPPAVRKFSFFASLTPDYHYSFISSTTFRHQYANVREKVVNSDKVKEGVLKAVTQDVSVFDGHNYDEITKKHEHRVRSVFSVMCAHINRFVINITGWILLKLLRRLFRTVQVQSSQLLQIKKATEDNLPIVFLPNHRSHLDYILLTFILWQWDIRAPHVAAGDNLDIPVFGYILQCLGGFFIKRRLDDTSGLKDYVYRSVLHSYMTELLKAGEYVEFFIEAGRSRSGKTVLPKSGLLAVVAETVLEDDISNCYLVPVSISYEKIVDSAFLAELCGEQKLRETFWGTIKAVWQSLRSQFGSVRIDFGQPILLKGMLEGLNRQEKVFQDDLQQISSLQPMPLQVIPCRSSLGSLCGSDMSPELNEDVRFLIKDLGYHICYDFTENTAQMCTNLLSFLLLNKYSNGGKLSDIVEDFHWLVCQVIKRGKNIGFSGNASDVVRYALKLLGPQLVSIEVSDVDSGIEMKNSQEDVNVYIVKPSTRLPEVLHLAYYKNSVVPVFLLESIVVNAILTLRSVKSKTSVRLSENEIIDQCFALCDLLRLEFLFCRPCISLKQSLIEAINLMIENGLIKTIFTFKRASEEFWDSTDSSDGDELPENKFYVPQSNAEKVDDIDRNIQKQDRQLEIVLTSELNMDLFKFYANVLKPFLHSYLFAVEHLTILNEQEMTEINFVKYLLTEAKQTLKDMNEDCFIEFANMESFRNATKWFLQKRIVKLFKVNELDCLRLLEPYQSNEAHLKSFQKSFRSLCSIGY